MGSPYTTVPVGQGHTQTPCEHQGMCTSSLASWQKASPGKVHKLQGYLVLPLKQLIKILLLSRAGNSKTCTILYIVHEVDTH